MRVVPGSNPCRDAFGVGGNGATQPAASSQHEARITQLPAVQPLAFVLLPWCFLYPAARIPSGRLPLVGRGYLPAAPECTGPVVVAMLDLVVRMLLWCSLLCALPMCSRRTSVRSLERSAAAGFALLAAGGVRARSCVGMLLQENVPRGNFSFLLPSAHLRPARVHTLTHVVQLSSVHSHKIRFMDSKH